MLDISNICRICLKEEDPKLPIFTENDEKSESKPTLPEKIMSFARVKVVKDDGLPMYICVKCYCQVDTTVEFKRLCEESFHFFTRQLDSSNRRNNSTSVSTHANARTSNVRENYSGQQWAGSNEPLREESDLEYLPHNEPAAQVYKITGNDESWIESCEKNPSDTEIEPQMIKCEPLWDYSVFDFDMSDARNENGGEGVHEEDGVNPLEISSDQMHDESPYDDDALTATSSVERTCKCRSCEMVFSNRREMGFHISIAHRRCGTCGKYFFSNKDKDTHLCSETDMEDKPLIQNRSERTAQCCRLCNKWVKQMRSHMAWHRKRDLKRTENSKESISIDALDSNAQVDSFSIINHGSQDASEKKIKCHLCDAVCLNQKGFKIHIACMHRDHRIVYACPVCNTQQFFGRTNYKRHMLKKHGLLASGNIQFQLKHVADCDVDDAKGGLKSRITKNSENINSVKAERKFKKLQMNSVECNDHAKTNNFMKKILPGASKTSAKQVESNAKKSHIRTTHPPFSTKIPIINNNFDVIQDSSGIKIYTCRGCNVRYKRYISAYHHYYTITKRAAKLEQNQLIIENKPYNCKYCTLKFASRSQAMMHRIHAHKYFYKKLNLDKKYKNHGDFEKFALVDEY